MVWFSHQNDAGLPVTMGEFMSLPVILSLVGLAAIIGLERLRIKGSILWVIITITMIGLLFDPAVKSDGAILKVPSFGSDSLFMQMDVMGALNTAILPVVFALVMTAIFDATGYHSCRGRSGKSTGQRWSNHQWRSCFDIRFSQ